MKEDINIVIVGHVDHGKSTVIGRLMADTDSLPQGKLSQVKEMCRRNSKPFEYAFLLDALKDEQSQGITIDSARVFFKTQNRDYIIIDAPGHIEFLKNMVTGAARAEAALLVIDAHEGIQENSRRHGYLLSMLGIKQIAVVVNKMDLVDYSQARFYSIVEEFEAFLNQINIKPFTFIPVSGMKGDNVADKSSCMHWFKGDTVLDTLEKFHCSAPSIALPFRMNIQDIYKFTNNNDNRRIIAGTIDTGKIKVGDEIVFHPSGKKNKVKSIEVLAGNEPIELEAGNHIGFTLDEQIYLTRGEIVSKTGEPKPKVSKLFKANIFWLGKAPLIKEKSYLLKIGTQKVKLFLKDILKILNSSNLTSISKNQIDRYEVAECIFETQKPVSFDLAHELQHSSRFVIVDNYEIWGGGIITEELTDETKSLREKVLLRNYKWENSLLSKEQRAIRYGQQSALILITGPSEIDKKSFAKELEKQLFNIGRFVYYLGIGNILYGIDADIKLPNKMSHREEHIRRFGETINLMLDTGLIIIATASNINMKDEKRLKTIIQNNGKVIFIYDINKINLNKVINDLIKNRVFFLPNYDLDGSDL